MKIQKVSIMSKKVLKKFRSSNVIYDDYSIEVSPFTETGESSRTDLVESGGGKMYVTKGSKKKTRCIHLSVDANDPDPVRKLYHNYINISKCLHYNEDSLKKQCKLLAKRGSN